MHQIQFRLHGAPPRVPDPTGRAYSACPGPLTGFKGSTSKRGRRGNGRKGMEGARGSPKVGSHPHVPNPEKYPGCKGRPTADKGY